MKMYAIILTTMVFMCALSVHAAYVNIGDAGTPEDSTGYGEVGYGYKISGHEVSIAEFATAVSNDSRVGSGNEGWWNDGTRTVGDDAPVVRVSWYEAAKYCNWLTTRDAYHGAYQFDSGGTLTNVLTRAQMLTSYDRYYVLPTEDEWYKAAYYTGNSGDYWSLYSHGLDTVPPRNAANGWNYYTTDYLLPAPNHVWEVSLGGLEQNGTFNMMGNVWEWIESAADGTLDVMTENRVCRGGSFGWGSYALDSSWRNDYAPTVQDQSIGFRVVVIHNPHPSTIDPANQYAYGANIGWINAYADSTNGAVIGQSFCSGYMYSANCGWIHLGDGAPANGLAYANDSANDYGVNHGGAGNLSGYAYGANIGWINFEQTYGMPSVDLLTGNLSGYAWSANVGWINLTGATTLTLAMPDVDSDGISDAWEYGHANNLALLGSLDSDGDGISDLDEYTADTDPFDAGDYLAITGFQSEGTTNWVTWTCEPTRLYMLQHAVVLSNGMEWTATSSSFIPPFGPEVMEEVPAVTDSNRFYRVEVALPLNP